MADPGFGPRDVDSKPAGSAECANRSRSRGRLGGPDGHHILLALLRSALTLVVVLLVVMLVAAIVAVEMCVVDFFVFKLVFVIRFIESESENCCRNPRLSFG